MENRFYSVEEGRKMGLSPIMTPPEDDKAYLALTKMEYDRIGGIFRYWLNQPDFNKKTNGVENTFKETRTKFIKWTYEYLRQFWPNVKYKILDYKKSFIISAQTVYNIKELPEEMYDTVSFKFAKGRPELFLLIGQYTTVMDERRFNAYDEPDGKFIRPNWNI